MDRTGKKLLSLTLALVLSCSLLPVQAMGAGCGEGAAGIVLDAAGVPLDFMYSSRFAIGKTQVGQKITSYSVAELVSGGQKPYTFRKSAGPAWIDVSADGTVSGTPDAAGANPDLVIRVTDGSGSYREITIPVAETDPVPGARTAITKVDCESWIDPTTHKAYLDCLPSYGAEAADHFHFLINSVTVDGQTVKNSDKVMVTANEVGTWMKRSGTGYVQYMDSVFTEGTYRYRLDVYTTDLDEIRDHYILTRETEVWVDGERWETIFGGADDKNRSVVVAYSPEYEVRRSQTLSGGVVYTSGVRYMDTVSIGLTGALNDLKDSGKLHYQWQREIGGKWENIADGYATGGAKNRTLILKEEDSGALIGDPIRVKITADGYGGEVYSQPRTVEKASRKAPDTAPSLTADPSYTAFTIVGYGLGSFEYYYSDSDTPPTGETEPNVSAAKVTGLTPGKTYYLFARSKGNYFYEASPWSKPSGITLSKDVYLSRLVLVDPETGREYANRGKIYVKKDQTKTLAIRTQPMDANKWNTVKLEGQTGEIIITGDSEYKTEEKLQEITIKADSSGTLWAHDSAYPAPNNYGQWSIVVYDDPAKIPLSDIDFVKKPSLGAITLSVGDSYAPEIGSGELLALPAGALGGSRYAWFVCAGARDSYSAKANDYIAVDDDGRVTAKKNTTGAESWVGSVALFLVRGSDRIMIDSYRVDVQDPALVTPDVPTAPTTPTTPVTPDVPVTPETPAAPETAAFADVPSGAYYKGAVAWGVEKGITGGTSATTFSPDAACTRAQIVTFLWRAAGSPQPKNAGGFADVASDAYYAKAVAWAVENGITSGVGNGKFGPDAACTRAQAVTFLYRASGAPAVSGSASFADVASDAYYAKAVKWAADRGITGGVGGGRFGSDSRCTRAQIVTFIYGTYHK